MATSNLRYLELLSRSFPTAAKASAEIINLKAILNLPKGTEFFCSDIHGEAEAFSHILRNASGSIRMKVDEVFGDELTDAQKRALCTLIYYPQEKLAVELGRCADENEWFYATLPQLVEVCRRAAQKHTRSKVRRAMPADFAYIIEELMSESTAGPDKEAYYQAILRAVVETGRAREFVVAMAELIQRLSIDQLHIVGDIYDRGPAPDTIMDALGGYHAIDIQWGNHDVVWMGASLGQPGCIAHVVRNCARYGNLSILEDAYGINILPLAAFAMETYRDDPCVAFGLKGNPDLSPSELDMNVKIQKAMAIIQFKVEGALIDRYPEFGLDNRKLLDKIDYERGTVVIDGVTHELTDKLFPTVDPADPYRLTAEEQEVMDRLAQAFTLSEKLTRHMRFFLEAGSLYKVCNNNLLFHACVPLNADGTLMETDVFGKRYAGQALYDTLEQWVREAFFGQDDERRRRGRDLLWWMWLSPGSPLFAKSKMATFELYPPLFAKSKMATFELYLVADKAARKEHKNPFYALQDDAQAMGNIFRDFGLDPKTARIICGHVPVKVKDGEDPVRLGGQVLTIDGGFSKAYQPTTGIAGYTLISNSYGMVLAAHEPLESAQAAVEQELDIHSVRRVVDEVDRRTLVADTDTGAKLKAQIADLEELLSAYRSGLIAEKA